MSQQKRAAPLPEELRQQLVELIATAGENEARRVANVSRSTFARAVAGLTIWPGTAAIIRFGLEQHRTNT